MFEQFSEKAIVGTLLILGWEVFALLTIFNIVMKSRSASGAWGWSMAVLAVPFIAVPLYWVLGRSSFNGYVERLREARKKNQVIFRDLRSALRRYDAPLEGDPARYGRVLEKLGIHNFTKDNEICLLINGEETFASIFEAIEAAERYVLVQFFIIRDDGLGGRLRELLERKSQEGVDVYLLYDEIGCHTLPKSYVASLRHCGVKVRPFHSTQGRSNRFQVNFRNHRKIVVVDGKVGFVGGHNVGDEYLGLSEKYGDWRDTHVRLVGPAVLSLQLVFLYDYYWAAREVPSLNWTTVTKGDGSGCGAGQSQVLILPTAPEGAIEDGTIYFLNAITRARQRIWIASPYFVTDETIHSVLQMAALRGVDVRIMIPGRPDKWVPWLATFSCLEELSAVKVRVFRYNAGFLHQKVFVVDENLASVGTANFDNRSMRLNFEVSAVSTCPDFARRVAAMLEDDFENCREVTGTDYTSRPWWFRILVRIARLFDPVL